MISERIKTRLESLINELGRVDTERDANVVYGRAVGFLDALITLDMIGINSADDYHSSIRLVHATRMAVIVKGRRGGA